MAKTDKAGRPIVVVTGMGVVTSLGAGREDNWRKLTAGGGQESMCGWLKDRFGFSWQIVPRQMGTLMGQKDPQKANRVMHALLQMKKLDIAKLEQAADAEVPVSR